MTDCLALVMKFNILSMLLCFCSALVVANSQTVPYFHFLGENLTNHSFVDLNAVGFHTMNVHCRTDLETCCNSDSGDDRGDWFYPSGDRLTFNSDEPGTGVYFLRRFKSVYLRFPGPAFPSDSGIYKCTIETIAVHSEDNEDRTTREVLYLGVYASGGDVTIPMGIDFTQDSELNGQTNQFTLTCISIGGPATTVTWTRDSESLSGGSTVLSDSVTGKYIHTLTVVGRLEGVYTCNVSNNKPSLAVRSLTVEAPDPPSHLQIAQTGQRSVRVSWIPSPGSSVNVTGYIIYLTPQQGEEMVSNVEGSETSTEITDLTEAMTYSVTIVANSNTLSSNVNGPENITLEVLTIALFAPSPVVIGSSISIVCSVTLPDGLTGPPTVAWLGPKYIPVSSTMSHSGQVFNATLDINNIPTSRAGQYMCTANISILIVSEVIDIIIQVPSPLPALPNIIKGHSTPLYAATSYSLTCNYTLNELVDINLSVVVSWTVNGSDVDTSQSRITTPSNSLVFNPLALLDSGSYTCRVSVSAQQYIIVQGPQYSLPVDVMIEDLPPPLVSTSSDSELNIDDQQTLDCSVYVIPFLIVEPTLEWVNPAGTTVASTTGQSLLHTVNVERTSVAGLYVCRATVDVAAISMTTTNKGYTSISVQMPQPNVVISSNRTGILYAGSSLQFTCTVSLDSSVDTIPNVSTSWSGPRAIPGDWYTVTEASGSDLTYTGSLSIAPLADDRDDGMYMCSVTVTGDNYILEATASASTTLEVTNLPHIEFEISTSGLLLASQSLTFECRANIVDDLIELPSLWLEAPNGTTLTQTSSATTLHYTLPSLDTSDGGVYTCVMVLVITGSGINRQRKVMKEITVVDAYPVEQLRVVSNTDSSLEFSWQPPQLGHDFTTAFKLTCFPLLSGIPFPQPPSTNIGADVTTQSLTDLYSGVPYNCSVVTVTSQGESEPRRVVNTTVEIAPSGPPLSFQVAVGVNDVTFSWSPPEITLRNGEIISYSLSCSPHGSTIVTIMSTFAEPGTQGISGFSSSTDYNCSLVASNSKGNSPPATKFFTTQGSPESAGFDSVPVVSGVVVVIFIIAVMAIVITVMVLLAKRHRYKYILRRARPNAYVTRGLDSGSATVTANLSADYGAKNGATHAEQSHEYEMIPIATYSTLPPGKRLAAGYKDGEVHITANTHVTSPIDTHSTENGKGSRYEMIRTYSNIGPSSHLYEVPKLSKTDGTLPDVRPNISQYAVPRSRQNTMTDQSLSLSTRNSKRIPPQYDMPRSRNNTLTQGSSSTSTINEVPQNLYSIPHSRQNTLAEQSSVVGDTSGKTSHYDKLDEPSSTSNIPATLPRENEPEITVSKFEGKTLNTYAVPRSSTISQTSYSPLVAIDLGVMSGDRPIPAPTGENSSQIKSSK